LNGIILLDKPAGCTSFQSLGTLKARLGTGKVGHTGTLDRFAEGLLVVLSGAMTRLCPFATAMDKEYVATVRFGLGTDTLDPEGAVTGEGPVPSTDALREVLPEFLGTISQVPPEYSAVHVQGRRASEAALMGAVVRLEARSVTVNGLDLRGFTGPEAVLVISCSKGTYVRALARDIAARLGTFAHVSKLRRTRVGGFSVEEAVAPEAFDPDRHVLPPAAFFAPATGLARLQVRPEYVDAVSHGAPFSDRFLETGGAGDGIHGAFSPGGGLIAVLERDGSAWRYAAVLGGNGRR
jgi:tRNA pseudouridine55 synthase